MYFQGQKVVCIEADWDCGIVGKAGLYKVQGGPEVGAIYTIDRFWVRPEDGKEFFFLIEFPGHAYKTEAGIVKSAKAPWAWLASHFRPANTKSTETGMSILRKIALTGKLPAKQKEKEAA